MAEKTYIGVSDVAKEVTKAYIGVNGVAEEVNKIYVGVNGIARLVYTNANVYISHMFASMVGQPFKIYNGSTLVLDATFPSADVPYGWRCEQTGTYTLKTSDNTCETQFIVSNLNSVTNVDWYATSYRKTFAAATNAEIEEMVESADKTGLNLYDDCAWRVGQEHTVSLSAMASSGTYDGVSWSVNDAQPSQNVVLILANKGGYSLLNAVKGDDGVTDRTTCSFIATLTDTLSEAGYMFASRGSSGSWNTSPRRYWCNSAFYSALPSEIRSVAKKFYCRQSNDTCSGSLQSTIERAALVACHEVGYSQQAPSNENVLPIYTLYETSSNRVKPSAAYEGWWWTRSPSNAYSGYVDAVVIDNAGQSWGGGRNTALGICPIIVF